MESASARKPPPGRPTGGEREGGQKSGREGPRPHHGRTGFPAASRKLKSRMKKSKSPELTATKMESSKLGLSVSLGSSSDLKSAKGAVTGPAAVIVVNLKFGGDWQSRGFAGHVGCVGALASRLAPWAGGESTVRATWVMPRAVASNGARTFVSSAFLRGNSSARTANPPGLIDPDRHNVAASGWVMVMTVAPAGGVSQP